MKKNNPDEKKREENQTEKSFAEVSRSDLKSKTKYDLEKIAAELLQENQNLREQNANLVLRDYRHRLISRNSPDTILFQNQDMVYVWTLNSTRLLSVDQVIGKTDFDLLSPEEASKYQKIKQELMISGENYYQEITREAGENLRYYSLLFQPWQNDDGENIGIATYFRDITSQKKVEEDLKKQLEGETLVAEIAASLISVDANLINEQIPIALQKMAEYLLADMGYIRFFETENLIIRRGFEWHDANMPPFSMETDGLSMQQFSWSKDHLGKNQPIYVPDAAKIPDEASNERDFLIKAGIRSMVLLPLFISGTFSGYLGFSSHQPHPFWSEREKALLDLFQSTLISVLERCERESVFDEARERYQKLVDFSPNAIFVIQDHTVKFANPSGLNLLGLDHVDQLQNKKYHSFIQKNLLRKLKKIIATPQIDDLPIEIDFQNLKGVNLSVDFKSIPIKLRGENASLLIGVDITHRKDIEKEIEGNRRMLNDVLNISPLAVFVYDRVKESFEYFNKATCDLFGCTEDQLRKLERTQIIQMVHPEHREKAYKQQIELTNLPIGQVVEGEYHWIKMDGSDAWLHMYQSAISRAENGTTTQSMTIVQDITEMVRSSHELSKSEEEFKDLVENTPGVVYRLVFNAEFTPIFISDYFKKITLYETADFCTGKINWIDVIHPDDQQKLFKIITEAADNRIPFIMEYRIKQATGDYIWVNDTGHFIYDDGGSPIFINGILMDITSRKKDYDSMRQLSQDNLRLLAQARRDSETKTLLLNEVNHRVKNNISSIIGLLELESSREVKSIADYQHSMQDLRYRITSLATVHDILSSNQWSPVQMELFTRKIVENAAASSPLGRKVLIEIFAQDKGLWINARQATALALILNELTTNAVRHAFAEKEKGTITITIRREEKNSNRVRICFTDDGPGWPDDVMAGTRENVGLQVIRLSVASPLYGEIKLENHNGAVAIITFTLAPQRELIKAYP